MTSGREGNHQRKGGPTKRVPGGIQRLRGPDRSYTAKEKVLFFLRVHIGNEGGNRHKKREQR